MVSAARSVRTRPSGPAPPGGRRRVYLAGVAGSVIAAYTAFVLVNTRLVGHDTRVLFLPELYLQDALDIVAASVLVLIAILVLDRLLERDQALQSAAAAVEAQRRFLADTSHELRNPLTSLSMNLSLLQREDLHPDLRREAIHEAAAGAARMQRLVHDLLLLARGDTAEMLHLEVVDLDRLMAEVVHEAAAQTGGRGPSVIAGPMEPAAVIADSDRIRQVLWNVLENARRFTLAAETITLALRCHAGSAVMTCSDTGAGIAPEHVPHVFERFYQADPARSGGGAGLGLAIVKHLVEAHGGRVDLASILGTGTTVTISLPLASSDA